MRGVRVLVLIGAGVALGPLAWGGLGRGWLLAGAPYLVLLTSTLGPHALGVRVAPLVVGAGGVTAAGLAAAGVWLWGNLFALAFLPYAFAVQLGTAVVVAAAARGSNSPPGE